MKLTKVTVRIPPKIVETDHIISLSHEEALKEIRGEIWSKSSTLLPLRCEVDKS